ncbi:ACP S-malonyltransferase [Botrimarina mediterranea]|uniref:Malonyl CoA-acyl carrier protein transacylase n=1 Tax=Botrimarina mediterranea TaxID=2528022 RepID=A0A518KCH3_9BACT|nr:ACP S-malonyltransferase [Botrimarina mediterranea]QDV75496.1 Malonyl CoA-acyl carrier protein transacylase [Botrimarina mediterranea]QDV80129.1 Malonyl CoA-acyl carrier protein transacylase [Planctomycetes bacterium K2D]
MAQPAFLFPGQGAQSVGMAGALCDEVPAARELFDRAAEQLGFDLLKLCVEGPAEQLDATVNSQPALYVASLAALEKLKRDDPATVEACVATAGLSLGEYTALCFAEALSFEDGLKVVAERGAAMQDAAEAVPSGMVSVLGLEVPQVEELCDQCRGGETLQVANLLCPGNTVVSGTTAACERIAEAAEKAGAMKVIPLAVAGAFHTPLMQPAVERLSAVLDEVELVTPRVPVVSNVDARAHNDPNEIRSLLVKQVVSPVLWEKSLRQMIDGGVDSFYEIGPGRVLRGLLKRIDRKFPSEGVEA